MGLRNWYIWEDLESIVAGYKYYAKYTKKCEEDGQPDAYSYNDPHFKDYQDYIRVNFKPPERKYVYGNRVDYELALKEAYHTYDINAKFPSDILHPPHQGMMRARTERRFIEPKEVTRFRYLVAGIR